MTQTVIPTLLPTAEPSLPDRTAARTILITGATSGIGLAAAEELAARGWQILGVGRSPERCRQADAAIRGGCPEARLAWLCADLATQADVRRLASEASAWLAAAGLPLDVLLNCAATVRSWYTATPDGYEMQSAVNHLAGYLLARLLQPQLAASPLARVLTVSSASHKGVQIRWGDIMNRRRYSCLRAYQQSKLCNVLFTREFNRRAANSQPDASCDPVAPDGTPVRAIAVDPGLVRTEIGSKWTGGLIARFWNQRRRHGISAWQAAAGIVWLCKQAPDWQPADDYYQNCEPAATSRAARDPDAAARLWELSARLCGLEPDSPAQAEPAGATGRPAAIPAVMAEGSVNA